jgi:hypothetical protein
MTHVVLADGAEHVTSALTIEDVREVLGGGQNVVFCEICQTGQPAFLKTPHLDRYTAEGISKDCKTVREAHVAVGSSTTFVASDPRSTVNPSFQQPLVTHCIKPNC